MLDDIGETGEHTSTDSELLGPIIAAEAFGSQDAVTMPADALVESPDEPKEEAQGGARFGSLSPSEAASRRWEQSRARKAAQDDDDPDVATEVRWVRVPVRTGEIIRKLNADARKGSVQAAKELRAWLDDVATDDANRLSDLDRRTRQTLLDRLLADIEDEREAEADPSAETPTPAMTGTPAL